VLAAEHLLRLARIDLLRELVQAATEIVGHGLSGFRPFHEHRQVVGALLQGSAEGLILFEPAPPLQQLLGRRLVLPEIRLGDTLFDFRQFVCVAGGVKDSSAVRRRAWRDPRNGGAARRVAE
jgi:hypothetical protein